MMFSGSPRHVAWLRLATALFLLGAPLGFIRTAIAAPVANPGLLGAAVDSIVKGTEELFSVFSSPPTLPSKNFGSGSQG